MIIKLIGEEFFDRGRGSLVYFAAALDSARNCKRLPG